MRTGSWTSDSGPWTDVTSSSVALPTDSGEIHQTLEERERGREKIMAEFTILCMSRLAALPHH